MGLLGCLFLCEVRGNFLCGRVNTGYRVEGSVRIRQPHDGDRNRNIAIERQAAEWEASRYVKTGIRVVLKLIFRNEWDTKRRGVGKMK
jgi:hypothetical protein